MLALIGVWSDAAIAENEMGKGSQYALSAGDANSNALDGGKFPINIQVGQFLSVILNSDQTRLMIQTAERFPSVSSQDNNVQAADVLVDFGLKPDGTAGKGKQLDSDHTRYGMEHAASPIRAIRNVFQPVLETM